MMFPPKISVDEFKACGRFCLLGQTKEIEEYGTYTVIQPKSNFLFMGVNTNGNDVSLIQQYHNIILISTTVQQLCSTPTINK